MNLKIKIMKAPFLFIFLFLTILSCDTSTKEKKVKEIKIVEKEEIVKDFPKNQKLSIEQQIASASLAAPYEARKGARIYGYDEGGEMVLLREGNNNFICIADNPKKDGYEVVSYHSSLEPYMSRGRTLNNEGKSRQEKEEIRESEAKSGIVNMPEKPAALHIYYGKNGFYNIDSTRIENAKYRYVVYIPYATQETTGLSLKPNAPNHPWLMFPGKYNAHIMISPKE